MQRVLNELMKANLQGITDLKSEFIRIYVDLQAHNKTDALKPLYELILVLNERESTMIKDLVVEDIPF